MSEQESNAMNEQDLFKNMAGNYLVCLADHCPRHDECLRWLAGRYAPTDTYMLSVVNPLHPMTKDGSCEMYRKREKVTIYYGMTHFYDEIPEPMAKAIRRDLEQKLNRTAYFKYRGGDRPITPTVVKIIEDSVRTNGWQGSLKFDREDVGYDW